MGELARIIRNPKVIWDRAFGKRDLAFILDQANPESSLSERLYWFETFFRWLRSPATLDPDIRDQLGPIQMVRVKFVLGVLERNPVWKSRVTASLRNTLMELDGVSFFSSSGLAQQGGFFSEASDRIVREVLPRLQNEHELSEVVARLFNDEGDPQWMRSLDATQRKQVVDLFQYEFSGGSPVFQSLDRDLMEAALAISVRTAALGLSADVHKRLKIKPSESPFILLQMKVQRLYEQYVTGQIGLQPERLNFSWNIELEQCRQSIRYIFGHLESSGVSVHLVFVLENISDLLDRLDSILNQLLLPSLESHFYFFANLVEAQIDGRSLRGLIQSNLHLLSRKVVERTGHSGEHYITRDRAGYLELLKSAAGGGALTAFTTIIKYMILRLNFVLFFEGLFNWINYSGSFLLMQRFHFTLATKQPSMTASTLAGKLSHVSQREHLDEFTDEFVNIFRSQFIAAVGNVGLVFAATAVLHWAYFTLAKKAILSAGEAEHIIHSLHPLHTLTIPFAVLTGVLLFASSLVAGWLENWAVYRHLPEAIAEQRHLIRIFGAERVQKFSHRFFSSLSGIGGNVSLGFFLAFTPIIGKFFGVPLQAPHVTLSTGALTLAFLSRDPVSIATSSVVAAGLAIVGVGLLNFGVSFGLALFVAMKARKVRSAWLWVFFIQVLKHFKANPKRFFFPGD